MILFHEEINEPILNKNYFTLLEIENKRLFRRLISEIHYQENRLNLFCNSVELDFVKHSVVVYSPFTIELNNRRTANAYLKYFEQYLINEGLDSELLELWEELCDKVLQLIENEALITINDVDITIGDFLKKININVEINLSNHFIENIEEFMLFKNKYEDKKIFFWIMLSNYISVEEFYELENFANREEVYIILLENKAQFRIKTKYSRHLIIDDDLCEIIA